MADDDRRGIVVRIEAQEARASVEGIRKVALYLATRVAMILHIMNQGMIDRRSRGPWRPGDSLGRHALHP